MAIEWVVVANTNEINKQGIIEYITVWWPSVRDQLVRWPGTAINFIIEHANTSPLTCTVHPRSGHVSQPVIVSGGLPEPCFYLYSTLNTDTNTIVTYNNKTCKLIDRCHSTPSTLDLVAQRKSHCITFPLVSGTRDDGGLLYFDWHDSLAGVYAKGKVPNAWNAFVTRALGLCCNNNKT